VKGVGLIVIKLGFALDYLKRLAAGKGSARIPLMVKLDFCLTLLA
jgi:hypothetical protein